MKRERQMVYLFIGFVLAVIIGTLSHEAGHYLAAKLMGFDARINYMSTSYTVHEEGRLKTAFERFMITAAGPLQTILTGMVGLLLLIINRKSFIQREHLRFRQWLWIFLALFWLRQVANLCLWVLDLPLRNGDEIKLSRYLRLPDGFLIWITGVMGIAVTILVVFYFVPKARRRDFISAGIAGAIIGSLLWFGWIGKLLLP